MNLALLVIAASVLFPGGGEKIEAGHATLGLELGETTALLLALALLASGFAASSVGTLAGQVVMEGFLRRQIPLTARRLVTLSSALVVLALGVDPTRALVFSQVVLSFGIPFALVPLIIFTRRIDVMGPMVNRRVTSASGTTQVTIPHSICST